MTLWRAFFYFLQEAGQSWRRSWRVNVLAVVTMGISLFLCSLFLLAFQNLSSALEDWRATLKVVVYLRPGASPAEVDMLREEIAARPWVRAVDPVSAAEASRRFREWFPSLAVLAEEGEEPPFSASIEAALDPTIELGADFDAWLEELRRHRAAEMVDADRDWMGQLATVLGVLTGAGVTLGTVFLFAAALTGASVLRLMAHLHREEIAIMRLVGATEFYIRGPFYVEGLLQGLGGAALALVALLVTVLVNQSSGDASLWTGLVFSHSLSWRGAALVLAGGGLTGLAGAVVSLQRPADDAESAS